MGQHYRHTIPLSPLEHFREEGTGQTSMATEPLMLPDAAQELTCTQEIMMEGVMFKVPWAARSGWLL